MGKLEGEVTVPTVLRDFLVSFRNAGCVLLVESKSLSSNLREKADVTFHLYDLAL